MSTSSFDHPLDDLAVYAVGALEPADATALEAHLATCAVCQAELAAHREALARLVVEEEPPPGLWGRIVADLPDAPAEGADDAPAAPSQPVTPQVPGRIEIRPRALRTPDEPPPLRPVPPPPRPPAPAADAPTFDATTPVPPASVPPGEDRGADARDGTGGRVGPLHLAGRPRRQRFARALTAAAAAVVLVVASVAATLAITSDGDNDGDDGGSPTEVAAPTPDALAQAAADDPTSEAQLATEAGEPQARLVNSDDGSFVFLDQLPTLPSGRAYQLWSLDSGTPVSLGVLGDGSGEAVAVAVPPSTVQVAISDAPAAGEPQPTGPIVATGTVQAV